MYSTFSLQSNCSYGFALWISGLPGLYIYIYCSHFLLAEKWYINSKNTSSISKYVFIVSGFTGQSCVSCKLRDILLNKLKEAVGGRRGLLKKYGNCSICHFLRYCVAKDVFKMTFEIQVFTSHCRFADTLC